MQDPAAGRLVAFFDAEAQTWERDHGPASARADGFRAITAMLGQVIAACARPPAMLDIGCASGAHLRALRRTIRLGVGVDLSPRMIGAARDAAATDPDCPSAPLRFFTGDATTLGEAIGDDAELRDQTFDLVTMLGVLEHVPDQARALAGAAAMLTPGTGRLVVVAPHRYSLPLIYHRIIHRGPPPPPFPVARHFTIRELARLARSAGLRIERVEPIYAPAWNDASAPHRFLRRLDRIRSRLPVVRRLGTFAAVLEPAAVLDTPRAG